MTRGTPRPRRWVAIASLVVASLALANWLDPVKSGLRADYFRNASWSGTPAFTERDSTPSTGAVIHAWGEQLPETFSVSWSGYLLVLRSGRYTFETISDDGSWLDIDGRRVVDNGGVHGAAPAAAVIDLARGVRAVHLEYVQHGGGMTLEWLSAGEGGPLAPLPAWRLTPRRSSLAAFMASAVLRFALTGATWGWLFVACAAALTTTWTASTRLRSRLRVDGAWPSLPILIGGSIVLSVVPIWWGLPRGFWPPDELTPKDVALAAAQHFSHAWGERYPPFHFYVLFVCQLPVLVLEWLGLVEPGSVAGETVRALIGRLVSLAASAGTLLLLFDCARRLFTTRAALMAVASLALVAPFVYYSKTANLDVPYLFWFALAFWFLVRLHDPAEQPRIGRVDPIAIAITGYGVAATLAICTKDQAYGLFVLPSLLVVWRLVRVHRATGRPAPLFAAMMDTRLLTGVAAAVVVFALSQNLLFNMRGFRTHLDLILGGASQDYRMFPATLRGETALLALTLRIAQAALGWPLLTLFATGAVLAWRSPSTRSAALLVSAPAVSYYLTFIAVVGYEYDRFLLPVFFLGAIFGGHALDRWLDSPLPEPVRAAAAAVALAYSLVYAASVDILMLQDSRYTVERFFATRATPQDRIVFVFPSLYNPRLDAWSNGEVTSVAQLHDQQPRWFVLNEDYGRQEPSGTDIGQLVHGLEAGTLGYVPVFRARTTAPFAWLPAPHRDLTGPRLDTAADVTSSLRHINPQFVVFERR